MDLLLQFHRGEVHALQWLLETGKKKKLISIFDSWKLNRSGKLAKFRTPYLIFFFENQLYYSCLISSILSLKTIILGWMQRFLDITPKIAPRSRFTKKWLNLMKNWKPMFQKFLQGHDLRSNPRGIQRVTLIFEREKLEISKWDFHHTFRSMRAFKIYLQIWKWLVRNQDIVVWRILVDLESRVKCRNWSN